MDKIEQFFKWFRALGGSIDNQYVEVLNTRYIYDEEPIRSFKDRAAEIKRKYNHKFKKEYKREVWDDFLTGEPNIDKLYFERKDGR